MNIRTDSCYIFVVIYIICIYTYIDGLVASCCVVVQTLGRCQNISQIGLAYIAEAHPGTTIRSGGG